MWLMPLYKKKPPKISRPARNPMFFMPMTSVQLQAQCAGLSQLRAYRDRTMFVNGLVTRFDQRHGTQILRAAVRGLAPCRDRVHQRRHGPFKGVGKPDLIPLGRDPDTRPAFADITDGARLPIGICGPADRAFRNAESAFDPPLDICVGIRSGRARARPDVVPSCGAESVGVLENVKTDAILMRE